MFFILSSLKTSHINSFSCIDKSIIFFFMSLEHTILILSISSRFIGYGCFVVVKLDLLRTSAITLDDVRYDTICQCVSMILRALVAFVCSCFKNRHVVISLYLRSNAGYLTVVSRIGGYLKTSYHVALGINSSLHIVAYTETLVGFHQSGIGIGKRNLAFATLLKLISVALVALLSLLAHIKFAPNLIL